MGGGGEDTKSCCSEDSMPHQSPASVSKIVRMLRFLVEAGIGIDVDR